MNQPKFKRGDKVRPLRKGISNYYQLKDLVELEIIIEDRIPTYSKKLVKVKIIKGTTYNTMNWNSKYLGDTFEIFEDCLELITPKIEDYDIY